MGESFPMTGGDGPCSYTKNSSQQRASAASAKSLLTSAILENLDIERSSRMFAIADFGCSTGPNTFIAMENIIEALAQKCKIEDHSSLPEFQVHFNDHVSNDFNTLFANLPSDRKYFAFVVPGSFHGRLFPKATLNIIYSAFSLQWLSKAPQELGDVNSPACNKGRIYYTDAPREVGQAYSLQYAKDMESFLAARAEELAPGGLMLILMPGRPDGTLPSQNSLGPFLRPLESCLTDMVDEEIICDHEIDSFNMPLYSPSIEELRKLIEKNGCFGIARLETLPPRSVPLPSVEECRSGFESILRKHFRGEIIEQLFQRYSTKIAGQPPVKTIDGFAIGLFVILKRNPFEAVNLGNWLLLKGGRSLLSMGIMAYYILIFALLFFSCAPFLALAQPFKAVNLGNWLVTEGWMKPSLYDGMPNNDLLDGTQVQFLSTKLQKYLSSENGGGTVLVANRPSASGWETFRLWRFNETHFNLRVFNKQFVGLEDQGNKVTALSDTVGNSQTFQIIRNNDDRNLVRLQASNGQFIQASSETLVTADYVGSGWNDSDPSVFKMTIVKSLRGEYQLTNGYGPDRAPQVLQDHWNSYITEEDFRFMSENSLNAVRIPVGWWIASDPTPPKPFVGGSLKALDNAFTWAQKYGMKVIVDLHGVQGSQNGNDHSGTRDGYQEWGESNVQETVAVIDFLAERYADKPSLAAIELMNEPMAPGVNLDTLKKYYQAGYDAVRKHSENAYVILSNRLGPADSKELLSFASGLKRVVIDVHYYNLFSDSFKNMNPQQNIDYIYNQRASALATVTTTNGPLSFIGEWTGEWAIQGASMQDYQNFAKAQLDVYGRATFGWAYWAYKCAANHWSLKWMIENNYIKL